MSKNNDLIFNLYLVLTAGIVDTCWYIFLTVLSTSDFALNYFKSKSKLLKKSLGCAFIVIGLVLFIEMF